MNRSFALHIRALDRDFFEGACVSVSLPVSDGQIGLMANRSPMVAAVVPGRLTYRLEDGSTGEAVVGHGIVRFENNDAMVLLDSAEEPQAVDTARAEHDAAQARSALKSAASPQQTLQARRDLERAENRLRSAKRPG